MSDPSQAAISAAAAAIRSLNGGAVARGQGEPGAGAFAHEALRAAHSPALGLNRSIRLGDVVDALRREGGRDGAFGSAPALHDAADWIVREFGGGR